MARTVLNTTASAERPYISKSKFLWGSQCQKLVWYAYNAKDQIPEPDAAQQAIFDQGHEVGTLAKSLYPLRKELNQMAGGRFKTPAPIQPTWPCWPQAVRTSRMGTPQPAALSGLFIAPMV
jgi:hypothetical protein